MSIDTPITYSTSCPTEPKCLLQPIPLLPSVQPGFSSLCSLNPGLGAKMEPPFEQTNVCDAARPTQPTKLQESYCSKFGLNL